MSSFAAKEYYPSLTDNAMDEDSTIATLSAPITADGSCSKHPHIKMRTRNSEGAIFQKESCPECEKDILDKAAALRAGRAQVGKELEKLDSSNHNNPGSHNHNQNHNNGNGMNDPYRYGVPNDDRNNVPHYGNGPPMGMQDNSGMYRGNNGNNNGNPGNSSNNNNSGPAPSPYFASTPAPPPYGNDAAYSRSAQLTMDSLASQMNMMQQMQDRIMQQKEMEMQGLRQKVEQQQQELMKKEIEIALLKDRLSQQDERLQQELKYMELQYASKAHSSGKSNRNGTKKEIHIKSLHVSVNGADGGRNPEDIDPKIVQEATAKATTAAIENAERQMEMGHTKVNKTTMVLDGNTGAANNKQPSPKQREVMTESPSPKMASSPVPDVYQAPPQQQPRQQPTPSPPPSQQQMQQQPRHQPTPSPPSQQDRVVAPISMSNNSNAMANIVNIADKEEDEQEYVQDDDSDAKIIEDVDAQEAADLRQEEPIMGMEQKELALAEDDDEEEDQDDGYELVKQPEPAVKEERKEYTFTPPGANPKEEPVPPSVADEEEDDAEGEDEFNPDPVWEAPSSEIKPKAAPEPAPFKQGPLTQAVAASRAPAVDLNPSRNNPEENVFDNIDRPEYYRHSSIPRDLNIGGDIVGDEDVTMATFEANSVFRGHTNDGEDGRSMGGTVASSTYGEDRQKVVEQTLLDPYGDKGRYTGVVLRSTGMPHGLGRMLYEDDGRTYEGDWRHGRWHGHGHATFANGDSYEGEYRFDQRHGRGIYAWNDGRVYDGVFAEDKRHGTGTFKWPDGATYIGDFVQGQREGKGRYTFSDGGYYNGEWVDGRYEGYGECHWEDGRTYKGEWQSGMAHGKGSETYPDGRVRHSGQWMNDEPIRN